MYQLVTDSGWDYPLDVAKELDIKVIPFSYSLDDGKTYLKDMYDLPVRELYDYLIAHPGQYLKTAQPSLELYIQTFTDLVKEGKDIICFTLSSSLTGSINSAMLAKAMVEDDYPNAKIEVIDTRLATLMQGLAIKQIALYKQKGATYEQALTKAKEIFPTARIFFTIENLDYLVAGGRINAFVGGGANLLNMRPILILENGRLTSRGMARGRKKSIKLALNQLMKYIKEQNINPMDYQFIVGYGNDKQEGEDLLQQLKEELTSNYEWNDEIEINQIGNLIAIHAGPYPCGIGMVHK